MIKIEMRRRDVDCAGVAIIVGPYAGLIEQKELYVPNDCNCWLHES